MPSRRAQLLALFETGVASASSALGLAASAGVALESGSLRAAEGREVRSLSRFSGSVSPLVAVEQELSGELVGSVRVVMQRPEARRLVAALTATPTDSLEADAEREAVLVEVGNVVVGGVLGVMPELETLDLSFGLPRYDDAAAPVPSSLTVEGSALVVDLTFRAQAPDGSDGAEIHAELAFTFDVDALDVVWTRLRPQARGT